MATPPTKRTAPPPGPSPEALAAFYKMRSESLRDSHTTTQDAQMQTTPQQPQPADNHGGMGWLDYLISALKGHPGQP